MRNVFMLIAIVMLVTGCARNGGAGGELFVTHDLTPPKSFTSGVEGPAVDGKGNVYAVNFARQGTIGRVTPKGRASVFAELPKGSIGNGIRFNKKGEMFIADYTKHNVLRIGKRSRSAKVFAHEPRMNQPNDLAIDAGGILYASDPNWKAQTGQIWRIDRDGRTKLLETGMGTTNGIEVDWARNRLYVGESRQHKIWAYDLTRAGEISNKRLLIEFPDKFSMDGMRCAANGDLYVTRNGKGTIAIVSPGGKVVREVELKGKKPTNITFGGSDGRTCYVTMADRGNIEWFRTDTPGQGS
ncbi:SMP-30/gluconolactonase/LRE family protein [bacterium]|nr:SMP-30/gluconolactonase/LRE family protein [bacterium]